MTDFDSSPTTIYITSIDLKHTIATMEAYDDSGQEFTITLSMPVGVSNALYWFAQAIKFALVQNKAFPLISQYDEDSDEWFVWAGNYGIHSRDLHFTPKA